jgi:hypothetical protein
MKGLAKDGPRSVRVLTMSGASFRRLNIWLTWVADVPKCEARSACDLNIPCSRARFQSCASIIGFGNTFTGLVGVSRLGNAIRVQKHGSCMVPYGPPFNSKATQRNDSCLNGASQEYLEASVLPSICTILVKHRDRMALRGGVRRGHLMSHSRSIIVVDETEEMANIWQDFVDMVTSMCVRILRKARVRHLAKNCA